MGVSCELGTRDDTIFRDPCRDLPLNSSFYTANIERSKSGSQSFLIYLLLDDIHKPATSRCNGRNGRNGRNGSARPAETSTYLPTLGRCSP